MLFAALWFGGIGAWVIGLKFLDSLVRSQKKPSGLPVCDCCGYRLAPTTLDQICPECSSDDLVRSIARAASARKKGWIAICAIATMFIGAFVVNVIFFSKDSPLLGFFCSIPLVVVMSIVIWVRTAGLHISTAATVYVTSAVGFVGGLAAFYWVATHPPDALGTGIGILFSSLLFGPMSGFPFAFGVGLAHLFARSERHRSD